MSNLRVGQEVVCIAAADWSEVDRYLWNYPQEGSRYTIRSIEPGCCQDYVCVRVDQISNDVGPCSLCGVVSEPKFGAWRFRPVVEHKTDAGVAMLKKLLDPSPLEPVVRTNLEAVL